MTHTYITFTVVVVGYTCRHSCSAADCWPACWLRRWHLLKKVASEVLWSFITGATLSQTTISAHAHINCQFRVSNAAQLVFPNCRRKPDSAWRTHADVSRARNRYTTRSQTWNNDHVIIMLIFLLWWCLLFWYFAVVSKTLLFAYSSKGWTKYPVCLSVTCEAGILTVVVLNSRSKFGPSSHFKWSTRASRCRIDR